MQTSISRYDGLQWYSHQPSVELPETNAQLVLCFAAKKILATPGIYSTLQEKFPGAAIVMSSTAGEIFHTEVGDDSLVAVAIHLAKTPLRFASVDTTDFTSSYDAALALVRQLPEADLTYIMVFSDGSLVNGSELVKGLNDATGNKILVTGGLAGDAADFKSTLVGLNEQPAEGKIVAVGFYGKDIIVSHGSKGGWEMFGPEREVTGSEGNKLFEIDHKNALGLYKKYLGPDADNLPASALLFPLSVVIPGGSQALVRTILSIDEENNSMTFAGDIPVGSRLRFMKANFDKLTSAASSAAQHSILKYNHKPGFALLISCVGRKLVLGSRIEEEVEAVAELLGNQTILAGFYSYGEISPFNEGGSCQLHNQTMTITSFYEL